MASKELFAQVEQIIWRDRARVIPSKSTDLANEILAIIFAALQEPTEGMRKRGLWYSDDPEKAWSAMLARSPLGEQSE